MYVVCYDIPSDKLWNKLFKLLKGYGKHCQYSVFECELTRERFSRMYGEIVQLLKDAEGNVRIYELCATCRRKTQVIGVEDEGEEPWMKDEELDMLFL